MEPNTWEEVYKPYQTNYYDSISNGIIKPISFEVEEERDWKANRKEIIKESLDIDKVICPIRGAEPGIDFSSASTKIKDMETEAESIKSLFTIRTDFEENETDY